MMDARLRSSVAVSQGVRRLVSKVTPMHFRSFICLIALGWIAVWEAHAARPAAGSVERELAAFHQRRDPQALEKAWPHLDSPDRAIRTAARRAIMAQPFDSWKRRALDETRTQAALEALTALVEACPAAQADELRPHICEGLTTLHIEGMTAAQRLATVALTRRTFARLGGPTADERGQMTDLWMNFLPAQDSPGARGREFSTAVRALLKFLAPPDAPRP